MTVSCEGTEEETQTQRSHVEMEAETGGMRPPARGRLGPPELEEAGRPLPGACGGSTALGPLDLRCLVSRTGTGDYTHLWSEAPWFVAISYHGNSSLIPLFFFLKNNNTHTKKRK